jgi:N-methylhydantoinase A
VQALTIALREHQVAAAEVSLLSHATTVVTNAILEDKGARCVLVATRDFRDVLELRRSARADLYDLFQDAPSVLIPHHCRFEVSERIDAAGAVVTPLDESDLDPIITFVRANDIEAIAVSLLYSFLNDEHERIVGARLRAALPNIPVFLSSEVLPEIREFERTSTTAVCAYVGPILESYLRRLEQAVSAMGLPSLYVMGSSGGVFDVAEGLKMPAMAIESGPAAGVIAAALIGRQLHKPNLLSFDMGGTTAKASLVKDGVVEATSEYEVGGEGNVNRWMHGTGHPIRVPVVDLAEVSGGGSIAWVDPGDPLRVGPKSAGAEPGPVCYGNGGTQATVTDCNLVLGYLDPDTLLAGRLRIRVDAARTAIDQQLARPLGISTVSIAWPVASPTP